MRRSHHTPLLRALSLVVVSSCWTPGLASAHGGHEGQPPGIIDPLITHHAILEDELKLNYFGSMWSEGRAVAETGSLEIAVTFSDLFGAEVFLPFGFSRVDGELTGGLGDLELQVPKVSFLRTPGVVLTTFVAVRIPTGGPSGLGEPGWTFAPHLLGDFGVDRLGVQVNAAVEIDTLGDIALEGNLSIAYSFALSRIISVSPLVELNVEAPLASNIELALTPGLKLRFEGFHVGLGVQLPLTDAPEYDYRALIQIGYHLPWEGLFGEG